MALLGGIGDPQIVAVLEIVLNLLAGHLDEAQSVLIPVEREHASHSYVALRQAGIDEQRGGHADFSTCVFEHAPVDDIHES